MMLFCCRFLLPSFPTHHIWGLSLWLEPLHIGLSCSSTTRINFRIIWFQFSVMCILNPEIHFFGWIGYQMHHGIKNCQERLFCADIHCCETHDNLHKWTWIESENKWQKEGERVAPDQGVGQNNKWQCSGRAASEFVTPASKFWHMGIKLIWHLMKSIKKIVQSVPAHMSKFWRRVLCVLCPLTGGSGTVKEPEPRHNFSHENGTGRKDVQWQPRRLDQARTNPRALSPVTELHHWLFLHWRILNLVPCAPTSGPKKRLNGHRPTSVSPCGMFPIGICRLHTDQIQMGRPTSCCVIVDTLSISTTWWASPSLSLCLWENWQSRLLLTDSEDEGAQPSSNRMRQAKGSNPDWMHVSLGFWDGYFVPSRSVKCTIKCKDMTPFQGLCTAHSDECSTWPIFWRCPVHSGTGLTRKMQDRMTSNEWWKVGQTPCLNVEWKW